MPLFVEHRRTSLKTLKARYGDPVVLDVTSRGPEPSFGSSSNTTTSTWVKKSSPKNLRSH
jgi:hypothetical protein